MYHDPDYEKLQHHSKNRRLAGDEQEIQNVAYHKRGVVITWAGQHPHTGTGEPFDG
jgi:hypothetical protein